jgi:ABC-type uncharacterized transport system auxiliary subunit
MKVAHAHALALARLALALALTGAAAGCALTSKSDSVVLRYFSPVTTTQRTTAAETVPAPAPAISLRLGRVTAARHLREKLAYRDSAYELGYYDDLRWTDKPDTYLRRALRAALFEDHRAQQIVAGPGLTLEVELDAFEEVKAQAHAGRVGVTWALRDDRAVLAEESFVVEREFAPKAGAEPPTALVAALSGALDEAVTRIVSRALQTATCGHAGCSAERAR